MYITMCNKTETKPCPTPQKKPKSFNAYSCRGALDYSSGGFVNLISIRDPPVGQSQLILQLEKTGFQCRKNGGGGGHSLSDRLIYPFQRKSSKSTKNKVTRQSVQCISFYSYAFLMRFYANQEGFKHILIDFDIYRFLHSRTRTHYIVGISSIFC